MSDSQSRNGSAVGRLSPPRKPRKWRGRAVRTARGDSSKGALSNISALSSIISYLIYGTLFRQNVWN